MKSRLAGYWLIRALLTTFLVLFGLAAAPSYAGGVPRHIAIDFGYSTPTDGMNDPNGEAWKFTPQPCGSPLDGDGASAIGCLLDFTTSDAAAVSSGPLSLGFDVNLNGVIYKQVHVNQNGVLTFGSALGAYAQANEFATLQSIAGTAPFIAAFYPSTTALQIPLASDLSTISGGGAEYGRGLANPTGTDVGVSPDIDGDVLAFKATWFECALNSSNAACAVSPTNPVGVRIVIYNRYDGTSATTDGDFDVRFEYNTDYNTGASGAGQYGIVGFSLGSVTNTLNLSGSAASPVPVPGPVDVYYQFRKGVLVGAVAAVSVPDVVNKTLAQATSLITGAGLVVGTTTNASSSSVALGNVISQDPAANLSVAAGSAVNLVVSTGPATVSVPNVVNKTLAAATTALQSAGLKVGTTSMQSSSTVPSGSVISQSPGANLTVALGSAVNLVLSTGPAQVKVPSVENQTLAAATTMLQAVGLKVGTVTKQPSSAVPAGSVISQNPVANTSVLAGTAVGLVVSSGALRGDVNGDGQVDVIDLIAVLESFGRRVGPGDPRDLNGDRIVNLKDASILVGLCTNTACSIRRHH